MAEACLKNPDDKVLESYFSREMLFSNQSWTWLIVISDTNFITDCYCNHFSIYTVRYQTSR